ncbi:MAG: amidohydrolase [Candidatus Cyclobacteriaceae bacterium M3_2C_046]
MRLSGENLEKIIAFRHQIHQHPELSNQEKQTPGRIMDFLKESAPDRIIKKIGGNGLALIYEAQETGPTLVFRAELDALPIKENNHISYRSKNPGWGHLCGHDGHMAVLAGLGLLLGKKAFKQGKVILLFQPAEETGEGAARIVEDSRFLDLNPDEIFAFHNLPKFPLGSVVTLPHVFAAASRGMIIKLTGATSHAAEPEHGKSPAMALSELIKDLSLLPQMEHFESFTLVTIIQAALGEIAFGTTPGYAELRATLRSFLNQDMDKLVNSAKKMVEDTCSRHGLKCESSWTEVFPATTNQQKQVALIESAASQLGLDLIHPPQPFKWSEDFGHYNRVCPASFFGLGAGNQTPDLHNENYDFPDQLIETGINLFYRIIANKLKPNI